MLGFLLLLALGFALVLAAETLLVLRRLRRPPRRTYAVALARGIPADPSEALPPRHFRPFTFHAPTRPGHPTSPRAAWEITGDNPAGPLIIASPGWGDSKLGVIPRLPALAPFASAIIAWDPAGLGESPGLCRLAAHADALDLCALVESQHRNDIVLFGWSLGAGLAIAAAAQLAHRNTHIAALIAEAPYRMPQTPARNVLRLAGLPHQLNTSIAFFCLGIRLGEGPRWPGFDRAALARSLPCPLLIIQGDSDDTCPLDDSRAIAQAAPHSRLVLIPGAGHNNLWTESPHPAAATAAIHHFLAQLFPPAI